MKLIDNAYRTNDIEELRPEPGYGAPFTPGFTISRNGPVYTSGTLNEALTGNYYNYRPNLSLSDSRPISHGKSWGNGRSATVARGGLVPEASRGVGQPSIDGMLTGNEALKQQYDDEIKQAVMAEFIRQTIEHNRKSGGWK